MGFAEGLGVIGFLIVIGACLAFDYFGLLGLG